MKINTEVLTDYLNETCNETTQQAVEVWLKESCANQNYFDELKLYWKCKSTSADQVIFDTEKAYRNLLQKRINQKQIKFRKYFQYAAIIALLITSGLISYLFLMSDSNQVLIVNNDTNEKLVSLPDSSTILLARGSSIEYPRKFLKESRTVQLTGNAFFKIVKDQHRPFIISTSRTQTIVLGTSFQISETISNTSIEVESGIVEFMEINNRSNKVRLVKGDVAKFVNKQHAVLKGKQELINSDFKIQHLKYQNQSLAVICNDLNELFNANIKLEGETIPLLKLTAVFENQNLENILETISFTLDLDIEKNSQHILLK